MSAPIQQFTKDLYKILHIPRTATEHEIKQSYRRIALALHPDRHNGCNIKSDEFKEASEAYKVLSNYSKRIEYDRWLDGVGVTVDGKIVKKRGKAAERNPHYRKVWSPAAPPGFKTFDRQRHYDMHYGDGMMIEAIERARKRAEAASPRKSGYSYQSPLGKGFSFDSGKAREDQRNPYSTKGRRIRQSNPGIGRVGDNDGFRIEYEEAYFDLGNSGESFTHSQKIMKNKELVIDRMKDRRKTRIRERGEPLRRSSNNFSRGSGCGGDSESSACIVM